MGLETASTINQLVTSNPDGGDARTTLDDHIRLIKSALKGTFPGIVGEVSASHGALNLLIGVNQNIQTQFDNLREGTATARNAINARFAQSASYAQQANSANFALFAGNANPTLFGVVSADISLSASTNFFAGAEITLSQSGMWMLDSVLFGSINNSALSATCKITPGLGFSGSGLGLFVGSNGATGFGPALGSASFNVQLILQATGAQAASFPGPAPGVVLYATPSRGFVVVSATAVIVGVGLTAVEVQAGQVFTIKRGSYVSAERIGNSP